MKIIDDVYLVPGVTANSYILVGEDGLTMIDTGLPFSTKTILKYLAGKGWAVRDIKRILITHADVDHYGCLDALQKASGARTYASALEAAAMRQGKSSRPVDRSVTTAFQRFVIAMMGSALKARPVEADEIAAEGQILPLCGGLYVVETPGHSPGHLSYFVPASGILFCGDSMRSDGSKGFRVSQSRNDWNHAQARLSAHKQAGLHASIVCPGHGPPIKVPEHRFPI